MIKERFAEPIVELVSYDELALEKLIYTKSGRLGQDVTLKDICLWPEGKKLAELEYMKHTIQTSFEFVDYVFKISNVSRAFTHQLVRTRDASYQQEAMRVVDARAATCLQTMDDAYYDEAINCAFDNYAKLVDFGYPVQDCRAILPTAVHTKIFFKANLRTLSRMAELRLCKRAEGEYQKVFKIIVEKIVEVHPWVADMLVVYCVKYGICCFPRYKECPVQQYTATISAETKHVIAFAWATSNHVANPVAKDGRTM